jgi:putative ABC transport system permease protein
VTGVKIVTPGYFQTIGLGFRAGRLLNEHDTAASAPVVVVNESFVKRFLPGANPLGNHILMKHLLPAADGFGPESAWEIVGVMADEKANGLEAPSNIGIYVAYAQNPIIPDLAIVAKGRLGSPATIGSLRRAIARVNTEQVLDRPMSVDEIKKASMLSRTLPATLLGGFALLAVLLASAGIYGVLSFVTTARTPEFGVRIALGADRRALVGMVFRDGAKPILCGLFFGFAGAALLARSMQSLVFGVETTDLPTLLSVTAILLAVASIACFLPAWRAARIDPMSSLRQE